MPPAPNKNLAVAKPYIHNEKPHATQAEWDVITRDLFTELMGNRNNPNVPHAIRDRALKVAAIPPGNKSPQLEPPTWTWDGARIDDVAAKLRFPVNPPFKVNPTVVYPHNPMKTWMGVAVNANISDAMAIVFDSNDRFEPYKHVCAHCAAVGNDRCIIALGYPSTSCLLCIANGVACTNKKKPAHQRRREAVLKLHVAAAAGGDRAWADKVLKEYEDAEAEAEEEL